MRTFTNKNFSLIISLRLKACLLHSGGLNTKCRQRIYKFKYEGCGLARRRSGNVSILLSVFFPHETDKICMES